MNIAILGAGSWGTTLAVLLAEKGLDVCLWSHRPELAREIDRTRQNSRYLPGIVLPENLRIEADITRAVTGAAMIVTAVPSQALRETLLSLGDYSPGDTIFVNVAKGIELETGKRLTEVILETLPGLTPERIAVLYGPSHAEEVSQKHPTTVVSASSSIETAEKVQEVFHTDMFRIYANTDVVGVEIAGSVKNIIAIAAGISDGLGFGDNAKAAIITRGLAEISRLVETLGGDPLTLSGLSGIGDLVVTCLSRYSRNRYVGEEIGKGRHLDEIASEMKMVAEGVSTTKAVYNLSRKLGVDMPITEAVYGMLFEKKPAEQAILDLMTRDLKKER